MRARTIFTLGLGLAFYTSAFPAHLTPPSTYTVGPVRVQALSATLVRVEVEGPRGFEDRPTFTVVGRPEIAGIPIWKDSETAGQTVLATSFYKVIDMPRHMASMRKDTCIDPRMGVCEKAHALGHSAKRRRCVLVCHRSEGRHALCRHRFPARAPTHTLARPSKRPIGRLRMCTRTHGRRPARTACPAVRTLCAR